MNMIYDEEVRRETKWLGITIFLMMSALPLPYVSPNLENVRWLVFVGCALPLLLRSMKTISLAAGEFLATLFIFNAIWPLTTTLWSYDMQYTFFRGISISILFITCIFVSVKSRDPRYARITMLAVTCMTILWVLVAFGLAVSGLSSVPFSGNQVWEGGRLCGPFQNANQLGVCMVPTVSLLLCFLFASPSKNHKIFLAAVLGIAIWLLIKTESRGALLGTIAGVIAFFYTIAAKSRTLILAAAVILVIVPMIVLLIDADEAIINYMTRGRAETLDIQAMGSNRLPQWERGWASVQKHFWLGQGYGVGGVSRGVDVELTTYDRGLSLHNSYLQLWQETGIVGLGLMVSLVFCVICFTIGRLNHVPQQEIYIFAGCFGVFTGGVVGAMFESWLFSVGNLGTMPFWLAASVLVSWSYSLQNGQAVNGSLVKE